MQYLDFKNLHGPTCVSAAPVSLWGLVLTHSGAASLVAYDHGSLTECPETSRIVRVKIDAAGLQAWTLPQPLLTDHGLFVSMTDGAEGTVVLQYKT